MVLLQVSGRKSDIGFNDDKDSKGASVFLGYHAQSIANFKSYADSKPPGHGQKRIANGKLRDLCVKGLDNMYCGDPPKPRLFEATRHIFEVCHDLELLRCYDDKPLEGKKLPKLAAEVGEATARMLAALAEVRAACVMDVTDVTAHTPHTRRTRCDTSHTRHRRRFWRRATGCVTPPPSARWSSAGTTRRSSCLA